MNDPNSPSLRGWTQPQGFGGGFPGLGNPGFGNPGFGNPGFGGDPFFSGPPALVNPTVLPPKGAGNKGGFTLGDVKVLVDRMGGIDGVLNGLGKFQKIVVTMQQMAPLLRIFLGKGGAAAAATAAAADKPYVPRRRTTRRRRTGKASVPSRRRTDKSR